MPTLTPEWRKRYEADFARMVIDPGRIAIAEKAARKINSNRARYESIEKRTGVPWYLIGCLHERESDGDFRTYLGDGEPLNCVTHNVPKGRGPFASFEDGAVDALVHEGFNQVTDWSIGSILFHAEEFNGEGYHDYHHMESPYVYAGSNIYTTGKYDVDGHFVSSLKDTQLGVAVILATMQRLGFITISQSGAPTMANATPTLSPSTPPVVVAAVQSATLSLNSIWSSVTGMFSSVALSGVLGAFSYLAPDKAAMILAAIGALGGIMSAIAHGYAIFTHAKATNNATILLAENFINKIETGLGGKPFVFDNDPPADTSTQTVPTVAASA